MFSPDLTLYTVKVSEKAIQYATPAKNASFLGRKKAEIIGRVFALVTLPAAIVDSINFLFRSVITLALANQYTGSLFDRISSKSHSKDDLEKVYNEAKTHLNEAAILLVSAIALPILGIIAPENTKSFLMGFGFLANPVVETLNEKITNLESKLTEANGEITNLKSQLKDAEAPLQSQTQSESTEEELESKEGSDANVDFEAPFSENITRIDYTLYSSDNKASS